MAALTSTEPATGEMLWTGETGDVEAEVAAARAAWAGWAARPLTNRVELCAASSTWCAASSSPSPT